MVKWPSFAVVLGAAALAIGLALQGTLGNITAGVMLLLFRPFKVDDVISVGGKTGKVNEIDLFTTMLDTSDNRRVILPNGQVFGSTIENITHHEIRRADVAVGVEYTSDIDQTLLGGLQCGRACGQDTGPAAAWVTENRGRKKRRWQSMMHG